MNCGKISKETRYPTHNKYLGSISHYFGSSPIQAYKLELRQEKADVGRAREKSTGVSFEMKCTLWLNNNRNFDKKCRL
jgi:hypothetical protein